VAAGATGTTGAVIGRRQAALAALAAELRARLAPQAR
jgi:hypothetical protein